MGRTRKRGKKMHLNYLRDKARNMRVNKKWGRGPKSLATLCGQVIKKHKLIAPPEPKKKCRSPETFTIVGGKPLRKRSERQNKEEEVKKKFKTSTPKSLVVLCQLVIEEYSILPQTETSSLLTSNRLLISSETPQRKRSGSQYNEVEKRPRGRPRKPVQNLQNEQQKIKRPRGRPRKDPNSGKIQQLTETEEPISYTYVRIKEETDSLPDVDPLQDEEDEDDYTVEIKLESCDDKDDDITHTDPAVPSSQTSQVIATNPRSRMQLPGTSKTDVTQTPQFVTVVMDEYQIFANRIAEQLREFPPKIAFLLQSGIQAMIDNERQLLDEN